MKTQARRGEAFNRNILPLEKEGEGHSFARNPSILKRGAKIKTMEDIEGKGAALESAKFKPWHCVFGKAGDSGGTWSRELSTRIKSG